MIKRVLFLFGCLLATEGFSSKEHYANHPAAKPAAVSFLNRCPDDIIFMIADRSDLKGALSLSRSHKKISEKHKRIVVGQLPNLYASRGLDFSKVYLQIDHPQWTPAVIPVDVQYKYQRNFFEAWDLFGKGPILLDDIVNIYRKFYGAACLGNMYAAEKAGRMLLNPDYNSSIPVVTTYEFLDKGVEPDMSVSTWDIRRLNRPLTDNEQLMSLCGRTNDLFDDLCPSDEEDMRVFEADSKKIMDELQKIEETDEVKLLKTLLGEIIQEFHYPNGFTKGFYPIKTINFAKSLNDTNPFINQFLPHNNEENAKSILVSNYKNNFFYCDFVINIFTNWFIPLFFNVLRGDSFAAETISNEVIKLSLYLKIKPLAIFLGDKRFELPSKFNNDGEVKGELIYTFLNYMILTRTPTYRQFKKTKDPIHYLLTNADFEFMNQERFYMLNEHFNRD